MVCWRNYVSEVSTVIAEMQGEGKKFSEFGGFGCFFSFDQLIPSKQYGLIYLSELISLVFYLQKKCS